MTSSAPSTDLLHAAGHVIDLARQELRSASGAVCELRPQAFAVLSYLALRHGRLVTKRELLAEVWRGMAVTDDSLVQAIGDIRRCLADRLRCVIKTVPRRGYMLICDLPAKQSPGRREPPVRRRLPVLPDGARVAVLAFSGPADMSSLSKLAQDFARNLLAELCRNADLRVVPSHASFAFAPAMPPLREIGLRLRARYLVDGRISRAGDTVRLQLELLDAVDERMVWAFSHRLPVGTDGAIPPALACRLGRLVHSGMQDAEGSRFIGQAMTDNSPEKKIWEAAVLASLCTAAAFGQARTLLEQVVDDAPGHATGWARLAGLNALDALLRLSGDWHPGRSGEYLAQAGTALLLEPGNPCAFHALSIAHRSAGNLDAALACAMHAVEMAPSNWRGWQALAEAQQAGRDQHAAWRSIRIALNGQACPPPSLHATSASILWTLKRPPAALIAANKALAAAPRCLPAQLLRLLCLHALGRDQATAHEATAICRQFPGLSIRTLADRGAHMVPGLRAGLLETALCYNMSREGNASGPVI